MRNFWLGILLSLTILSAQPASLYDSIFVRAALPDSALTYLNSTKKDLFFPVSTQGYPFTFPVVVELFKNQFPQVKSAEVMAQTCQNFPQIDFAQVCQQFASPLPELTVITGIKDFLSTVKKAAIIHDSAWQNCSAAEKKLIIAYFKQGQNSVLLSAGNSSRYEFAPDDLGRLFSSRINERESWNSTHNFYKETLTKLQPRYIIQSGILLYSALLDLQKSFLANPSLFPAGITESEFGRIAIGSASNDSYRGDYFLIIDPAGNDLYQLNSDSLAFQFILDFKGNDSYLADKSGPCFALNGTSLLFDLAGDDLYSGKDNSNAAAILGFAALLDYNGNDSYLTGNFGQAASVLGFASLWDAEGSDRYLASSSAQGFAGCFGFSILADEKGNDNYIAVSQQVDELRYADHFNSMSQGFTIGERDHSGGGIALLLDKSGNDTYQSDIFGQGAAYWLGFGALLDYDGHDSYSSYQYTQGSGVHFAFGTLLDYHGNDSYRAKGVSLGCGHDYAGGVFMDAAGDDTYSAESLSLGSGNADGISIFFDLSGNDLYDTKEASCLGYSDWRRDTGYLGIFWDNGGIDRYTGKSGKNRQSWYNGTWGIGIDR